MAAVHFCLRLLLVGSGSLRWSDCVRLGAVGWAAVELPGADAVVREHRVPIGLSVESSWRSGERN